MDLRKTVEKLVAHGTIRAGEQVDEGRRREAEAYLAKARELAAKVGMRPQEVELMIARAQPRSGPPREELTEVEALKVVCTFGRHRGQTMAAILDLEPDYIVWLVDTERTAGAWAPPLMERRAAEALLARARRRVEEKQQGWPKPASYDKASPPVEVTTAEVREAFKSYVNVGRTFENGTCSTVRWTIGLWG